MTEQAELLCSTLIQLMAASAESIADRPLEFRAPPPSPVASGRRSCVTNDDALTEFLENSLRVPDLILPDKIFPKQKFIENPSKIDFSKLGNPDNDSVSKMVDSIARVGCFQLVNYSVRREVVSGVLDAAGGLFGVKPEKKGSLMRSADKPYGFEEVQGDDESDLAEEFVWCNDEGLKSDLETIWPKGYLNFSDQMVALQSDVEKIAEKLLAVLCENSLRKSASTDHDVVPLGHEHNFGTICCLFKHIHKLTDDKSANSLRYDVIKMLIKGSDHSHALCLHICDGSSEFHVYSKKGWVSFCPEKDSIIVTVGDQFQALSGGQYKHVVGRPIYKGDQKDSISIAFLYSPRHAAAAAADAKERSSTKTISLRQQAIVAVILTLVYHILSFIYRNL